MDIIRECCNMCGGTGRIEVFKSFVRSESKGFEGVETEKVPCVTCDGKGCKEYARFTIEEANAILKHCGLGEEK